MTGDLTSGCPVDLSTLGDGQQEVAIAAAVLGRHSSPPAIAKVTSLPVSEVTTILQTLVDLGLVTRGSCRVIDDQRSGLMRLVGTERTDRMIRDTAEVLTSRGVSSGEVASLLSDCTPSGDRDVMDALLAGAEEEEAGGNPDVAARLLKRALEEGMEESDRAAVLARLGVLEQRLLLPEGPLHIAEALNSGLSQTQRALAHASLARFLMLQEPEAAVSEIRALRELENTPETDLWLESVELESLLFPNRLSERWWARTAGSAESRSRAGHAHHGLALALSAAPPSEVEQAIDLAVRDGSLLAEIGPGSSTWNLAIQALRFVDSHRFAESLLTIGMRSANAESASAARAFPEHAWAYWHLDFGLIPQAVSHAEKALGAIEGTGLPISELSIVAPLIEALIWAGNLDEASRFAETAIEPATGTFVEPFVLVARAMARVAAGRSDAAEEDLRRAVRIGSDRRWSAPRVTRARQRLAELLVDRGDAEEALELLQPDLEAAERIGSPGTRGIAMRCQALTLSGPARLEMQECAVGLLNQSPLRLDLARGLVDLAGTLLSQGDVEQARTAYRRALASAQSAGSKLVFQRAANGLREAGGRMRRTDFDGPGSLTDKELETARLAARGLSNREIAQSLWVTGKTIEFHLTNVYRKLGISSRSQLAGRLEEEPADLRPPGSVIPHR